MNTQYKQESITKPMLYQTLKYLIAIIVYLEGGISSVTALDLYVATSGKDTNPGTSAAPFRTIQKGADVAGQLAKDTSFTGVNVIVRDGIYYGGDENPQNVAPRDVAIALSNGGNSKGWITFQAENKRKAILDGRNNATQFGWFFVSGIGFIRIKDFEIRNFYSDGVNINPYINPSAANNIIIEGNHIHHIGKVCTDTPYGLAASYVATATSVTYERNLVHDIGRFAFGEVAGCNLTTNNYRGHDHGFYIDGTTNLTIRNNIFYNLKAGWAVKMSGTKGVNTNVLIAHNTFAFPHTVDKDGQIILSTPGSSNVIIENNIFYYPRTAAVRIQLTDGPTVFTGVLVRNNIVFPGLINSGSAAGVSFLGNNITGIDPTFVSPSTYNFELMLGSRAIDSAIGNSLTEDYSGRLRPQGAASDLGALEALSPASRLPAPPTRLTLTP